MLGPQTSTPFLFFHTFSGWLQYYIIIKGKGKKSFHRTWKAMPNCDMQLDAIKTLMFHFVGSKRNITASINSCADPRGYLTIRQRRRVVYEQIVNEDEVQVVLVYTLCPELFISRKFCRNLSKTWVFCSSHIVFLRFFREPWSIRD